MKQSFALIIALIVTPLVSLGANKQNKQNKHKQCVFGYPEEAHETSAKVSLMQEYKLDKILPQRNFGETCYMNSVHVLLNFDSFIKLQTLRNIKNNFNPGLNIRTYESLCPPFANIKKMKACEEVHKGLGNVLNTINRLPAKNLNTALEGLIHTYKKYQSYLGMQDFNIPKEPQDAGMYLAIILDLLNHQNSPGALQLEEKLFSNKTCAVLGHRVTNQSILSLEVATWKKNKKGNFTLSSVTPSVQKALNAYFGPARTSKSETMVARALHAPRFLYIRLNRSYQLPGRPAQKIAHPIAVYEKNTKRIYLPGVFKDYQESVDLKKLASAKSKRIPYKARAVVVHHGTPSHGHYSTYTIQNDIIYYHNDHFSPEKKNTQAAWLDMGRHGYLLLLEKES